MQEYKCPLSDVLMQEKDFKPYLSKIKELNPDLIFAGGYYFQTGPIIKQVGEMGINTQIVITP